MYNVLFTISIKLVTSNIWSKMTVFSDHNEEDRDVTYFIHHTTVSPACDLNLMSNTVHIVTLILSFFPSYLMYMVIYSWWERGYLQDNNIYVT